MMQEPQSYNIHALHGFLGRSSDWDSLSHSAIIPYDLFQIGEPSDQLQMPDWAAKFYHHLPTNPKKKILMGYSLGGRLALHALMQNPSYWDGAIIISAHPGLPSEEVKRERIEQDAQWAKRFEQEPWEELMHSWNARSVFCNSIKTFERKEIDYNRALLANTLRFWSLGSQELFVNALAKINIPILWVAGEKDFAYTSLAQSLSFKHSESKIWIASNSGHRVPWEAPHAFKEVMDQYIQRILG